MKAGNVSRGVWLLPIVGLSCLAGALPAQDRELLRDPDFRHGFGVLAAKGAGRQLGSIRPAGATEAPAWQLAQWHSRFEFTNFAARADSFAVSNAAKWLELARAPDQRPTLTLGVDSRPEYDGRLRRATSEPWVHLLAQQAIQGAPALAEPGPLRLRFETRLREAETFRPAGHTPDLHAAQFQVVLTLNNTRRGSPGFGDYLWFVAPVYDDRYEMPPPHVARDFAVTQGKLIYNPGAAALATHTTRAAGWTRFDADLRPWLERSLRAAWDKGYLPDSREPADYRVAHLNVGWEVPGLNRVAMDLRGLSLATTDANRPRPNRP
jgi:hypothetical protein